MERRTVYLHIGQTKTATTSLQAFFHLNREWLARHGVLYPEVPEGYPVVRKHRFLVDGLRAKERLDFARCALQWDHLMCEIAASSAPKVLVSEEVMWHLLEEQPEQRREAIQWMAGRLAEFDVKVVCYLRRQDKWVESYHNQITKTDVSERSRMGVGEFAERYVRLGYLDYAGRLDEWAGAFGEKNIVVRPFERGQFAGADIMKDFCGLLGIESLEGTTIPDDKQVSLSNLACELAECFNRAPDAEGCKREFLRTLRQFDAGRKDERRYLPADTARDILKNCATSNATVAKRFLKRRDGRLFLEPETHDRKLDYPGMSLRDLAEFTTHLYAAQQSQIEELRAAVEGARPARRGPRGKLRRAS